MPNDERPSQNTDRELWREPHPDPPGSYYANSIHVTEGGGIGINVGGTVIVRTLAQWHALEAQLAEARYRIRDANESLEDVGEEVQRAHYGARSGTRGVESSEVRPRRAIARQSLE